MKPIVSRKHSVSPRLGPTLLATGLLGASFGASATDEIRIAQARNLPSVTVEAVAGSDYRIDQPASPKFTQPLLDTPQTITIIGRELIEQQAATTLTEALRNSPGVGTFYAGENGSTSTGDAIYMRGFDSSGSIFVDGVRDLGSVSRDVFNIEQVEVTKGPDGTEYGRTAPPVRSTWSPSSRMHAQPRAGSVAYGSGQQRRASADWNQPVGQHAAFRLNLMQQDSGVPGRDQVRNDRWGVAPSLALGLGTPTRVFLDAVHVKQSNVPDGGVATIGLPGYTSPDPDRPFLGNAAPVDSSNFYGTAQDHDDATADMVTAIVEHDVSPDLVLHNTTRWGRTRQDYLLTSFMSSAANLLTPDPSDPSAWTVARSNPNFKHQTNRIVANQTHLTATIDSGAVTQAISAGMEVSREKATTTGMGAIGDSAWPAANLYHPDPHVGGLAYGPTGAHSAGTTTTTAAYLFDTLKFGERWQINAGLRLDHYTTDFTSTVVCGGRRGPTCGGLPEGSIVPGLDARIRGNLPNYKLGVLYKPAANGSVYVNLAQSQQPPGGNALALSSSDRSLDRPDLDPQKARTAELGTKWDLLEGRLLLTGALYRTTISNELVQDPLDASVYDQIGRKRVQGVELTAVGALTDRWAVSAGFTTMDARVVRGDSVVNDGSDALAYTPDSAFTAWSSYRLPFGLTLGGGARYAGPMKRGSDGAVGTPDRTGAYWVFDAMAAYPVNRHLQLQLNVYNLFDRHYVAAINKSGYRYTPGTPRAAMITAHIRF